MEKMKEGELKPGDIVDKWVIDEPIGGGGDHGPCIYACHHKDDPAKSFAFKLREPNYESLFQHEIDLLKKLNADGPHPSFQRLIHYNEDPATMYMVLSPLALPQRQFGNITLNELAKVNPVQFLTSFIKGVQHAGKSGVQLGNICLEHFFITEDGHPFFIGLCDEPTGNSDRSVIEFELLSYIFERLVQAAEYRVYLSKEGHIVNPTFTAILDRMFAKLQAIQLDNAQIEINAQ